MKKSITIWALKDGTTGKLPVITSIEQLRNSGFNALEISFFMDGDISLNSTTNQLKTIKDYVSKSPIKISSMSTLLFNEISPISDDREEQAFALKVLLKMLEIAEFLEIDSISFSFSKLSPSIQHKQAYEMAIETISNIGDKARSRNVKLCIENMSKGLLIGPLEFKGFLNRINNPYVTCCFDTGNTTLSGYPHHWIEYLGKYIEKVHITDTRLRAGSFLEYVNPGKGSIDWNLTMKALRKVGYNGYLTVEAFSNPKEVDDIRIQNLSTALDKIMEMEQ